ncbi:MAG: hypothetical protein CMF61_04270 [Magnetococcales bacterium]|nr:hypothetical protein [Magnetococcales bacterium]
MTNETSNLVQEAQQAIEDLEKTLNGILMNERRVCIYVQGIDSCNEKNKQTLRKSIDTINAFVEENKTAKEEYESYCEFKKLLLEP